MLKRKAAALLVVVIFTLSGCGQSDSYLMETDDTSVTEAEGVESEGLPMLLEVPVNTKSEDINLYYNQKQKETARAKVVKFFDLDFDYFGSCKIERNRVLFMRNKRMRIKINCRIFSYGVSMLLIHLQRI